MGSPKKRLVFNKNRKTGEKFAIGEIVKEVAVEELNTRRQKADYKKVLQLIKGTDGKYLVRLGYYLRDSNSNAPYRWGSQTTFQLPLPLFQKLLVKAQKDGIIS